MPVQKYRVDTDKGSYEVEVEVPESTTKIIAKDEPDTYLGGAIKGLREGIQGGLRGYAKGLVPGMVEGAKDVIRMPFWLAKEAVETVKGAGNLYNDPEGTLRSAGEKIGAIPGQAKQMLSDAAQKAATDPEGFGQDVGNLTGATMTGVATSKVVPIAMKPAGQKVGRVMQAVGEQGKWPIRMMGAHQLGSGNPLGIVTMALPEQLQKGGQALRIASGEEPAIVRLGDKAARKTQEAFDEAMTRRNLEFYDEQQAARQKVADAATKRQTELKNLQSEFDEANAKRNIKLYDEEQAAAKAAQEEAEAAQKNADALQRIEEGRAGMKESKSFSTTDTAVDEQGRKQSMTTRYSAAEEGAEEGAQGGAPDNGGSGPFSKEDIKNLKKQGFSDDTIKKMIESGKMSVSQPPSAGPSASVRAAVRVGGKNGAGAGVHPIDKVAEAENIANHSSYGNGHVMLEPLPTELRDVANEGLNAPSTGTFHMVEGVGASVPNDLEVVAGSADLPGITVGDVPKPAPKLQLNPRPQGSVRLPSAQPQARNLSDFMKRLDEAMAGAASKSKSGSGWKNLSDNDAITAANAYAAGERDPNKVIEAILQKRKGRQQLHVANYYADRSPR